MFHFSSPVITKAAIKIAIKKHFRAAYNRVMLATISFVLLPPPPLPPPPLPPPPLPPPPLPLPHVALRPNAGHGLLIHEVSRSHTATHHSR